MLLHQEVKGISIEITQNTLVVTFGFSKYQRRETSSGLVFGGSFTDTPNSIVETSNNEFIIVGSSDSNDIDISDNKGTYDFLDYESDF